jgi:hypothetical protein
VSEPLSRSSRWRDYFEAVTLGAFGNLFFPPGIASGDAAGDGRAERFIFLLKGMKFSRLALHFILISLALNFPVMFAAARLSPYELYSRLYSDSLAALMSGEVSVEDFNLLMYQSAYGKNILLPVLIAAFVLVLILQTAFYVLAALCMGLQRMTLSPLAFKDRLGLLLFSSTLAVIPAVLFGLYLPTVHILVFYLAVIVIGFRRSALCPNG